jgi:TolB-like protein/Tfp pilus assembly protein PilF
VSAGRSLAAKRTNLFAELKRRNVIRMAGLYLVIAWLVVQVAETVLPAFDVPGWVLRATIILLAIGFVPALVFSWVFELTPEGLKRDADVTRAQSIASTTGRRMDRLLLVGLAAVIAVVAADRFWPRATEPAASFASLANAQRVATQGRDDLPSSSATTVSIAVLPFSNMSPDPEQEFFADGITEDILTRLAAIGELRVISRTSIMRYKGSDKSLPQIAAELDVSHVLEGSVRRAGNRLRITGQLIRASDDAHLWAESFDRELADIFALQAEIAGHIVQALQLQLTEGEREQLRRQGTDNAAAYEQYLLGRAHLNQSFRSPDEFLARTISAEARFRSALEHEPDYADAWAGLAQTFLGNLQSRFEPEHADAAYQGAVDAARRAIRLAPESAAGYVRLGEAYLARGLGQAAAEQIQLAAEVEPDSVDVLRAQAVIHGSEGRLSEAVRLLRRAVRNEPGDAYLHNQLGLAEQRIGEPQRARDAFHTAWGEITPHEARLGCGLARIALDDGDIDSVRMYVARYRELESGSPFIANCSMAHFLEIRDLKAARQVFDEQREYFEERQPRSAALVLARTESGLNLAPLLARAERRLREELPRVWGSTLEYGLGEVELLRGNHEAALVHLETAVALGWRWHRRLEQNIVWDPIRTDPRFQALERRVDEDLARQRAELAGDAPTP